MIENNVEEYLIETPVKSKAGGMNHGQILTYVSDKQIPGINYYAQIRWITGMPEDLPGDRSIVSDSDKIILYWGSDYKEPEYLGGEILFLLDNREITLNSSSSVFVPRGVAHGPVKWNRYDKPHMEMTVCLNAGNLMGEVDADKAPSLKHLSDPEEYVVHKPVYEVVAPTPTKNRMHPSMTFISNDLIPGSNTYLEFSWIWGMPDPDPHIMEHVHEDSNELVFHIGSDPDNPEDLGAEIEIFLDKKPLLLTKTSALYAPRNISHGPLKWQRYARPHIEMAIIFGAGILDQSDPGGHRKSELMK